MASISAPISTFSPSFALLQKPTITTLGSPFLRFPSTSKMRKMRCAVEGKPAITSEVQPTSFDDNFGPEGEPFIKGKSSWPELVAVKADVATAIIEKENPLVTNIVVLLAGSPVTMDLRNNRVRLFVNIEDVVIRTPVIT